MRSCRCDEGSTTRTGAPTRCLSRSCQVETRGERTCLMSCLKTRNAVTRPSLAGHGGDLWGDDDDENGSVRGDCSVATDCSWAVPRANRTEPRHSLTAWFRNGRRLRRRFDCTPNIAAPMPRAFCAAVFVGSKTVTGCSADGLRRRLPSLSASRARSMRVLFAGHVRIHLTHCTSTPIVPRE